MAVVPFPILGDITEASVPPNEFVAVETTIGPGGNPGELPPGSVDTSELEDGSVTTPKLAPLAVATSKIGNKAVTTAKIADQAVDSLQLKDLSVINSKLGNGAVTALKIADNAVITPGIMDGNVTAPKLAAGVAISNLGYTPANRAGDTFTGDVNVNSQNFSVGPLNAFRVESNAIGTVLYFNKATPSYFMYSQTNYLQLWLEGIRVFTASVAGFVDFTKTVTIAGDMNASGDVYGTSFKFKVGVGQIASNAGGSVFWFDVPATNHYWQVLTGDAGKMVYRYGAADMFSVANVTGDLTAKGNLVAAQYKFPAPAPAPASINVDAARGVFAFNTNHYLAGFIGDVGYFTYVYNSIDLLKINNLTGDGVFKGNVTAVQHKFPTGSGYLSSIPSQATWWFDSATSGQTSYLGAYTGGGGRLEYTYNGTMQFYVNNSTGNGQFRGKMLSVGVTSTGDITSTGKILAGGYTAGSPIRLGLDAVNGFGSDVYNFMYLYENGTKNVTYAGTSGGTLHGAGWVIENQLMVSDLTLVTNVTLGMYALGGGASRPKVDSYFGGFSVFGQGTSQFDVDGYGHITKFGGNIKFPAVQVPSADPNTQDDYEEGGFTPVLNFGGAPGTTYHLQTGTYSKVGRVVTVDITFYLNVLAGAGTVTVTGLPFNIQGGNAAASGVLAHWNSGNPMVGLLGSGTVDVHGEGTTMYLKQHMTLLTNANFQSGNLFTIHMTYSTN